MENLEQTQAGETEMLAYTYRAWQDALLLLEGQLPPENEDYGPWAGVMSLLRHDLRTGGAEKVQEELMGLVEDDAFALINLPYRAVTPDGRLWREALKERRAEREREERWAALAAKAEEQERWKRSLARARADWRREREEMRAYGQRPEKPENWTPMSQWTLTELAWKIFDFLEEEDHSRREIHDHFSHNVSSERLTDALDYLELQGMAQRTRVPTSGRPREVWSTWFEEDEQKS